MTDYLISIMEFYIQLIILAFIFCQFLTPKFSFFKTMLIYFAAFLLLYVTVLVREPSNLAQTIIKLSENLITLLLLFKDSTLRKIVIFIASIFVTGAITLPIQSFTIKFFNLSSIEELAQVGAVNTAGMIILQELLFITGIVICIIYKSRDKSFRKNIYQLIIMLVFALIHFAFLLMFYSNENSVENQKNNIIQTVYQSIMITMIIAQYYNAIHMQKLIEAEENLKKLEMEMEHTYDYYMLADEKFSEISSLRHDIQNQIQVIEYLNNEGGHLEETNEIINQIQQRLSATKTVQFCENSIINSVMTIKLNQISKMNIDTNIILKGCSDLPFDKYDICSLFANLFDNAIDACQKIQSDEKFIDIKSDVKNNCFILKVYNSCDENINLNSSENLKSTKNSPNHGYGIKIINKITQKYNGSFNISKEGNTVTATAVLQLNINK